MRGLDGPQVWLTGGWEGAGMGEQEAGGSRDVLPAVSRIFPVLMCCREGGHSDAEK